MERCSLQQPNRPRDQARSSRYNRLPHASDQSRIGDARRSHQCPLISHHFERKPLETTEICLIESLLSLVSQGCLSHAISSLDSLALKGLRLPSQMLAFLLQNCAEMKSLKVRRKSSDGITINPIELERIILSSSNSIKLNSLGWWMSDGEWWIERDDDDDLGLVMNDDGG
ncbi:hypothetical protein QYF36_021433 [Acer negundo]|nr:hypothetical protein QYF36_021433 [Acer negundo]